LDILRGPILVTAAHCFREWFWFRWMLTLLEGRNVIVTGEDWMEYGQSWRWKGEEGMAYARVNGNWEFQEWPFLGSAVGEVQMSTWPSFVKNHC